MLLRAQKHFGLPERPQEQIAFLERKQGTEDVLLPNAWTGSPPPAKLDGIRKQKHKGRVLFSTGPGS